MTDDRYGKIHTHNGRGYDPLAIAKGRDWRNVDPLTCRACAQNRGTILQLKRELEAFKQEVSDAVGDTLSMLETHCYAEEIVFASNQLLRFITHKPKPEPDPLVEVMEKLGWYNAPTDAENLRAALEARGLEIRSKNDDQ
jgi:hypothetical protein